MTPVTTALPDRAEEQRRDDAMRDRLLGSVCFCDTKFDDRRSTPLAPGISLVIDTKPCRPLRCLAHGYCETHMTPVSAQMSDADKAFIRQRCGDR